MRQAGDGTFGENVPEARTGYRPVNVATRPGFVIGAWNACGSPCEDVVVFLSS